jgi:HSP20 family protein
MDPKASGLSDILRSLGDFVDGLTAARDGAWTASGEAGDERGAKAVYGVSVRMGQGGKTLVERFGTVRPSAARTAEDVREPMIDLFDEGDYVRVVAELPGVDAEDIRHELRGNVLSLKADRGERHYTKDIVIPITVLAPREAASYRNGIFEIKLPKAHGPEAR